MGYMGTGGNEQMAKAQNRPLKAVESPESHELTPDEAKAQLGILTQQNELLRGLVKGLATDLLTLRDLCNRVLG